MKNNKKSKRKLFVIIPVCCVVVGALAFVGVKANNAFKKASYDASLEAKNTFLEQVNDESCKDITVDKKIYLTETVEIKGDKSIGGKGSVIIKDFDSDYLFKVTDSSSFTLKDSILLDLNEKTSGVYVEKGGKFNIEDTATIKNAKNNGVFTKGTFKFNSGSIISAKNGIYVTDNGICTIKKGAVEDSSNDGVYVEKGGYLNTLSLKSVIKNSANNGITLKGEAVIDDIYLISSKRNQIDTFKGSKLTINNGSIDQSRYNGITNRGEMTIFDGEISNSKSSGIVNMGTLFVKGGRIFSNKDKGILNRNGSSLELLAEKASVTGNKIGVSVEENATAEIANSKINSNTLNNISCFGNLYIHDVTMLDSGSNCIATNYGGYVKAENITIDGTKSNNGIYNINNSVCELKNVTIKNVKTKGIQNKDGTLTGENITINDCECGVGSSAYIFNDPGEIKINGLKTEGMRVSNVYMEEIGAGNVIINNAELGISGSNSCNVKAGHLTLTDVKILGNEATEKQNTHGIITQGGDATLENVTIENISGSGIRNRGCIVKGKNVTIKNVGKSGISTTHADVTKLGGLIQIDGLTIDNANENNIRSEGAGKTVISNAKLCEGNNNNISVYDGEIDIKNSTILGNKADTKLTVHGIYMVKGIVKTENVTISNSKFSAIRCKGGVNENKNLMIDNSGDCGLSVDDGTVKGNNIQISNSKISGISNKGGKITLKDINISNSGSTGVYNSYNKDNKNKGIMTLDNLTTTNSKLYSLVNDTDMTEVNISNATFDKTSSNNVVVRNGVVSLNNVKIAGSSETKDVVHGVFATGGTLNIDNVTIKDAKTAGIRNKGAKIIGKDITIENSGESAISNTQNTDTKKSAFTKIENLTTINTKFYNILNESENATVEITNGVFNKTNSNNVVVRNGSVSLENSKILGNNETKEPVHSLFVTNGKVKLNNVEISDSRLSAIRCKGGEVDNEHITINNSGDCGISVEEGTVKGNDIKITDSVTSGISNTGGKIDLKDVSILNSQNTGVFNSYNKETKSKGIVKIENLTTENTKLYGLVNDSDMTEVNINNATFDKTDSNNIVVRNGVVTLKNVDIFGNNETKEPVHSVFITGGTLNVDNVKINDSKLAGIRNKGGIVKGKDVVIENSGEEAISITKNFDTKKSALINLENVIVSGSHMYNILSESDDATVEITNGTFDKTNSNNIAIRNGVVSLIDSKILGNNETKDIVHGVYITGGTFKANNVNITDVKVAGIRNKGGIVKGKDITVENVGAYGISSGPNFDTNVESLVDVDGLVINNIQEKDARGILSESGILNLKNTSITDINGMGIELKSTIANVSDNLKISNIKDTAIKKENSEFTGNNISIDKVVGDYSFGIASTGSGNTVLNKLVIAKDSITGNNIYFDEKYTGEAEINSSVLNKCQSNNVKAMGCEKLTINDTDIYGCITNNAHGIFADCKKIVANNVYIENSSGSGIRIRNGCDFSGNNISFKNILMNGVSVSKATVNIEKSSIDGCNSDAVYNDNGDVTINNLEVTDVSGHLIANTGNVFIAFTDKEQTLENGKYALYNASQNANAVVKGLNLNLSDKNVAVYNKQGSATINEAKISGADKAISNNGIIVLTNCDIHNNNYGLFNNENAEATLNGGYFYDNINDGDNSDIYNNGKLSLENVAVGIDSKNQKASGTVIMSGSDNVVHFIGNKTANTKEIPMRIYLDDIIGGSKIVEFDDNETANKLADSFVIDNSTLPLAVNENGLCISTVDNPDVAKVNDEVFKDLKSAIDYALTLSNKDTPVTVTLVSPNTIMLDKTIKITKNKNIIITDDGYRHVIKRAVASNREVRYVMFDIDENATLSFVSTGSKLSKPMITIDGNKSETSPKESATGYKPNWSVFNMFKNSTLNSNGSVAFKNNTTYGCGGVVRTEANANAKINIDFAEFSNNAPIGNGAGAINLGNGTANITNTVFSNNSSTMGGAILSNGNLNLKNCTFNNNSSTNVSGAIHQDGGTACIIECSFNENTSVQNSGAIGLYSGQHTITGCTFNKCSSTKNSGGAIYSQGSVSTIDYCSFNSNSAKGYGGAVNIDARIISGVRYNSNVTISNSTFEKNSASKAGAVTIATLCQGNLSNVIFNDNKANDEGNDIRIGYFNTILNIQGKVVGSIYNRNGSTIHVVGKLTDDSSICADWFEANLANYMLNNNLDKFTAVDFTNTTAEENKDLFKFGSLVTDKGYINENIDNGIYLSKKPTDDVLPTSYVIKNYKELFSMSLRTLRKI